MLGLDVLMSTEGSANLYLTTLNEFEVVGGSCIFSLLAKSIGTIDLFRDPVYLFTVLYKLGLSLSVSSKILINDQP